MRSYLLGFLGLIISLAFVVIICKFLYLKKQNTTKKRVIVWSILGAIIILSLGIIGMLYFEQETDKEEIFSTIIFSLILTPFLEEILYRRIILQHFLNLKDRKIRWRDFFIVGLIWTGLVIPTLLFNYFGWLGSFDKNALYFSGLFLVIPFISIIFFNKFSSPLNKYLLPAIIILSQAFIFTFGHGEYAAKLHLYTGLVYGLVYIGSKSILPSLVSHYLWNIIVFANRFL